MTAKTRAASLLVAGAAATLGIGIAAAAPAAADTTNNSTNSGTTPVLIILTIPAQLPPKAVQSNPHITTVVQVSPPCKGQCGISTRRGG